MEKRKHDEFFTGPKAWSLRKHRILGKYLMPFSAKVGSRNPEIYLIDGFAGPARYGDNYEGSPLLLARVADECAKWQTPVSLKIINVEAKRAHYKSLCEETRPWVERGIVDNKRSKFGAAVSEIVKTLGNKPAFFFIDPYGPSPLHFSYLRPILERSQPITELIINFDADGLRRLADDIHADTSTEVGRKACDSIVSLVDKIMDTGEWRPQFLSSGMTAYARELLLVDLYTRRLTKYGYEVVAYPIRESLSDRPKYWLIYCTRHFDGVQLMNGFIRREEDQLIRESSEKNRTPCMFDVVAKEVADRREELGRLICGFFGERRRATRGAVKRHFIVEKFAQFDEKDYNAAVQELLNCGLLRAAHGKNRINDNEPLTYFPPSAPSRSNIGGTQSTGSATAAAERPEEFRG
jgi:three-Cys-motif partner protein